MNNSAYTDYDFEKDENFQVISNNIQKGIKNIIKQAQENDSNIDEQVEKAKQFYYYK